MCVPVAAVVLTLLDALHCLVRSCFCFLSTHCEHASVSSPPCKKALSNQPQSDPIATQLLMATLTGA